MKGKVLVRIQGAPPHLLRSSNGRATVLHTVDRGSIPLRSTKLSLCNVNLVDGLIWSQEAVGSNPTMETNFALLFQRLEFRFCSPAMAVRVRHGAPSFVSVSKRKTL